MIGSVWDSLGVNLDYLFRDRGLYTSEGFRPFRGVSGVDWSGSVCLRV